MRRTVGIIVAIVCLAATGNAHADEVRVDPVYPDPIVVARERWFPRILNDRGQMVASQDISGTDLVFDPFSEGSPRALGIGAPTSWTSAMPVWQWSPSKGACHSPSIWRR